MPNAGLGDQFDLSIGLSPVDLSVAASTGKRVSLQGTESATIVLLKGAGTAGQDPVLTLKQHTAATGGVTTNLVAVGTFWTKTGAPALLGTEVWTQVTQTASATITLTGAAASEQLVGINLDSEQLTAGNSYVSLDIADVGINAQLGMVLYILRLEDHRLPQALSAPLR